LQTVVIDGHRHSGAGILVPDFADIADHRQVPLLGVKRIGWRCHTQNLKKNLNLKIRVAQKSAGLPDLCRHMKKAQGLRPAPE
jgi:hypothetical protein